MQFTTDIRSKQKRMWVEALMPGIIKQLKLDKSKHAVLVTLVNDEHNEGTTIAIPDTGCYIITINAGPSGKLKNLTLTLCHEMTHVKQMATGLLKSVKGGNLWKGKFYPSKTPYLDRPWEIQAFQNQELLMRRVIEL